MASERKILSAMKSRMVLSTIFFFLGAATSIIIIGNPSLTYRPEAANWFSALSSLAAVIVALGLGVHATLDSRYEKKERQRSAASVFLPSVSKTLGAAQAVIKQSSKISSDPAVAENCRQILSELPEITPPESLPFLPLLASNLASSAVLVGQRNEIVRNNMRNLRGDQNLAAKVIEDANSVASACLPFGNCLYEVIFPGHNPPWQINIEH